MTTLVARGTAVVHGLVGTLVRFNFIDRSLALGAQAFGAVIPLLIIIEAAQPGQQSLADELIERFQLSGAAAESLHAAFATPTDEATTTTLSGLVLVVSALSFTRRMQRMYAESWSLPTRGLRGTGFGLVWLAFLAVYASLHPALDSRFDGVVSTILSLAGAFAFGLVTPWLLLGRRKGGTRARSAPRPPATGRSAWRSPCSPGSGASASCSSAQRSTAPRRCAGARCCGEREAASWSCRRRRAPPRDAARSRCPASSG